MTPSSGTERAPGTDPMEWVELLAGEIGPRRPTGRGERLGAELVRDRLVSRGVDARLEDFDGYSSFGFPFGLIMIAAAAPALVPRRMPRMRIALALLAAAGLATEGSLTLTPLSAALSHRRSQNVVAAIEPHGEVRRTLCLMAHLDSSRSGLIFDPRFVGFLGRWITLNSALVVGGALGEPLASRRPSLRRALGAARGILGASAALLIERELRGQDVPGANDNASGCGVVATLATGLAAAPLESTRVLVCLTGCEESGTLGSRAFLRAHDTEGWLFLNIDNVGGGGTLRFLRREGVITHWPADPGLIDAAAGVAARRPELRMAPEDSPAGLTYDASPVLAVGGRALTLSIQDGSIPNLHWPTDTVENVDPDGVGRTLAATRDIVAAVDSGAAD